MKTELGMSRQDDCTSSSSSPPRILNKMDECGLFRQNNHYHNDEANIDYLKSNANHTDNDFSTNSVCEESENELKGGNSDDKVRRNSVEELGNGREFNMASKDIEEDEHLYVDCGRRSVAEETTQYAEILTSKPCKSTVSMSRRTRESSNPILRLRYDHDNSLMNYQNEDVEPRGLTQSRDDSALYENTRENGARTRHSKLQHANSDSEITYATIGNHSNITSTQDISHVYENSSTTNTSHAASFDNKGARSETVAALYENSDTESFYEDIGDVYEVMSPPRPAASAPINIVYTSVDFPTSVKTTAIPSSIGSCSISSSMGSFERSEPLTRCSSCSTTMYHSSPPQRTDRPPDLPERKCMSLNRAKSMMFFGNEVDNHRHNLTEFGMYTGTLVGTCTVTKNSPKSVQHIVSDFLAREKKERSKPVSLEVNNDFVRLSLNCAPWSLLAQNSVDDIGCVTTVQANNKMALGYTISKPGETTLCYVIHCSDVDAIKEAILSTFKRPVDPSISRWSSMSALGTPRSFTSRSLPRSITGPDICHQNDLATFDELVYLGSYKVKKSYLVVNDNITAVLDNSDSKHYTPAKVELYRDAIHLKDDKHDRILDIHQLEWILSMGLFDEDRRYFGYISSKAYQGSKTRTFCHVFRCTSVGNASRILEWIRQACQATFLAKTPDSSLQPFRSRLNSTASSSSDESASSSSETMSLGSMSSSPPDVADATKPEAAPTAVKRLSKRLSKLSKSSFRSYIDEKKHSDIIEEKEPEAAEVVKPCKPRVHRFNVFYLISTIVSPPLKQKHVKNCLKQYQKSVDKEMKKSTGNIQQQSQHYKKVQLVINENGVTIVDDVSKSPQAFFEKASLSSVQSHPEGKCAFAFSTVVSGNTKYKCHLFLQDKEPMGEIISVLQSQISSS